ncbi:MAG: hypothetical protein HY808_15780, partial [Nitrospirae bacterium]|nr:hypothetical protein [Nitrospirota bacterium]
IGTPSLSLGGTFTTSCVINIAIGTDTDVTYWLLSESQSTSPELKDSRWLASKPSVFSLSSGSGVKNVYLWVKDIAGNMSYCMETIVTDTDLPVILLSQPATNGFGTQNIQVSYSLSEDIATGTLILSFIQTSGKYDGYSPRRFALPGTSKGNHSFTGTYSLVDGAIYTITLEGADTAGNKAQMAVNTNWTYDLSAPIITLVKPSSNGRDNHELELAYVLSEIVKQDRIILRFNDKTVIDTFPGNKGTNTANIDISAIGLENGQTYTVTMQVEDMVGNTSSVTKINWTYDNYIGTPTLTIATSTSSRLVDVKITDDNEAVAWLLGEDKNAQSEGWRSTRPTAVYLSSAGAGVKQVDLWVRDAAGNATYTAASILLTATSTSAQLGVSIQSPKSGEVASQIIHLQYNLTQPVDPESLRLVFTHSAGANDPNSPHTVTNGLIASEGVHDVSIKGYDLNGDGNQTADDCLIDGAVYSLRLEAAADTLYIASGLRQLLILLR